MIDKVKEALTIGMFVLVALFLTIVIVWGFLSGAAGAPDDYGAKPDVSCSPDSIDICSTSIVGIIVYHSPTYYLSRWAMEPR